MSPSISLRFCNPRSLTLPWQVALPYLLGGYGKYQQAITQQKTFAILKTIIPHKKVNEYTNEKNKKHVFEVESHQPVPYSDYSHPNHLSWDILKPQNLTPKPELP